MTKTKDMKKTVLSKINTALDSQVEKGVLKYGHTLEKCPIDKYNWQQMLIEELIDGVQYQQKEIDNLSHQLYEIKPLVEQSYKERINIGIKINFIIDEMINKNKKYNDYEIKTLVIKVLIEVLKKQQKFIGWLCDLIKYKKENN